LLTTNETDGGAALRADRDRKEGNGVVSLSDKQILSLMKQYAVTGKLTRGSVAAMPCFPERDADSNANG
jgi:hypothetical protein